MVFVTVPARIVTITTGIVSTSIYDFSICKENCFPVISTGVREAGNI